MSDPSAQPRFQESAESIEKVLEHVRSRLGEMEGDTRWGGLAHHLASGTDATRDLADDLARSMGQEHRDLLLNLFLVRQLEVAMNFIAELCHRVQKLEDRLEQAQRGQGEA